jgi:hypothetical protein
MWDRWCGWSGKICSDMDAVSSAVGMATVLGFEVADPQPLRSTNNTVVWLRPSPVAKVAPAAGNRLAWELNVGSGLERAGAPVVGPSRLVPPKVHHFGGWAMTFWPYRSQDGSVPDSLSVAGALKRLHDAVDRVALIEGWSLPAWDDPVRDVRSHLGSGSFAPDLRLADRRLLAETLTQSGKVAKLSAHHGGLHGSPHGFNVLAVDGAPLFIDFETVCRGPVEWDLCHLDPSAAAAYPAEFGSEALALARVVVSAMTAALCWDGINRGEDMRFHAEHHLAVVRAAG